MSTDEVALASGNASGSVVRVADTVRKPWLPSTPRTMEYLARVRAAGVDVPRVHGRDDQGRLSLEFVPGLMAIDQAPLTLPVVSRVGAVVRTIHDAAVGLEVPDDWDVLLPVPTWVAPTADLICHNDLATWNLLIDGDRLVFIDWDGAGPSTRLWDLAYAAIAFAHLFPDADVAESAARLAAFVDGYQADSGLRSALPEVLCGRAQAMHDLLRESHQTGREPWATMFVEGHGEHWGATAEFVRHHVDDWRRALGA